MKKEWKVLSNCVLYLNLEKSPITRTLQEIEKSSVYIPYKKDKTIIPYVA